MKNFFKPEDFTLWMSGVGYDEKQKLADQANFKLQKLIESSPMVYGSSVDTDCWSVTREHGDTVQARLICIELMEQKHCEHEPSEVKSAFGNTSGYVCKFCGAELKVTWSEK